MSTSDNRPGERVKDVRFTVELLVVDLMDGRTISVPLAWYPRLLAATSSELSNWRISGGGFGIHWPDIDEDLSTDGLLRGAPAPRASMPFSRIGAWTHQRGPGADGLYSFSEYPFQIYADAFHRNLGVTEVAHRPWNEVKNFKADIPHINFGSVEDMRSVTSL